MKEGRGVRSGGRTVTTCRGCEWAATVTGRGWANTVTVALGSVESHLPSCQMQSGLPTARRTASPRIGVGPGPSGSLLQVHWTPFSVDRVQCYRGSVGPRSPAFSPHPSI